MKRIIVTSADENYAHLLLDLLSSLTHWEDKPFDAIGVLDVGLSKASLEEVKKHTKNIVVPDWDVPVDPETREKKPYLRASTARPFLIKYFPDYERYLWLDSDIWVQEISAVDLLFRACAEENMGIVPALDRCYVIPEIAFYWREQRMKNYFGNAAVAMLYRRPYYNAGVFSLRNKSPHWNMWAEYLETGINNYPSLICNQTALNFLLWQNTLPVLPLPATCNWSCHLALPGITFQPFKLVEPHLPKRPIGIIHLATKIKEKKIKIRIGDESVESSLRYSELASKFGL